MAMWLMGRALEPGQRGPIAWPLGEGAPRPADRARAHPPHSGARRGISPGPILWWTCENPPGCPLTHRPWCVCPHWAPMSVSRRLCLGCGLEEHDAGWEPGRWEVVGLRGFDEVVRQWVPATHTMPRYRARIASAARSGPRQGEGTPER